MWQKLGVGTEGSGLGERMDPNPELGQNWVIKALTGASDMSTGCRFGSDLTCLLYVWSRMARKHSQSSTRTPRSPVCRDGGGRAHRKRRGGDQGERPGAGQEQKDHLQGPSPPSHESLG